MCDLGLHPKKALPVTLTKVVRYFEGLWFPSTQNSTFSVFIVFTKYFANFTHCSKSWFFVQKFNFDFPRKLSISFEVKNSWKCCGFGLFSCWQLWCHEKICQKKFEWKNSWNFLDKKLTFRIVWNKISNCEFYSNKP